MPRYCAELNEGRSAERQHVAWIKIAQHGPEPKIMPFRPGVYLLISAFIRLLIPSQKTCHYLKNTTYLFLFESLLKLILVLVIYPSSLSILGKETLG